MDLIPDAYKKVPMMFQAQTKGRCQLNYIADLKKENRNKQDVELWTEQWIEKSDRQTPDFDATVQTKIYKLSWRFVTNGGQDEGIIRPVIGAKGVPFYPGSSMKGAFRQACQQMQPDKLDYYCGNADRPAMLRFHGGYPTDDKWQDNLIDLVHPQQEWQVKTNNTNQKPKGESAFALISLYQPELKFGISSTQTLDDAEWETIWSIWEQALFTGLGCRVSAGYGQLLQPKGKILYRAYLEGQGIASTVIGGKSEFRPNIFKAAIRGHALRIFGGLTDAKTAENLVETLFGGVTGKGKVGLLGINWNHTTKPILGTFDEGYQEPTYNVKGILRWQLTRSLPEEQRKALTKLIKALMRFAMLLGGFGKSWRRVDHRLFYDEYYDKRHKPLIGCHWKWNPKSLEDNPENLVRSLDKVGEAISQVLTTAQEWMQLQNVTPNPNNHANWRETWHSNTVQVWGRVAENKEDCQAIFWFHQPYRPEIRDVGQPEGSIYRTSLTGRMSQISRIWHRMYPVVRLQKDPDNPKKPIVKLTVKYLELITIFPDDSDVCNEFIDFLESEQTKFNKLW